MTTRKVLIGSMLCIAVMIAAVSSPESARADSRVSVGLHIGGVYAPYGGYAQPVYVPPPPPRYYGGAGWHRVLSPCPPRGWYHHPQPVYHHNPYRYQRPHNRVHYW